MKIRSLIFAAAAALALGTSSMAAAATVITNGGFTEGDDHLDGWTVAGLGYVETFGNYPGFEPTDGDGQVAVLTPFDGFAMLFQFFDVTEAGELSFDIGFQTFDDDASEDRGFATLVREGDPEVTLFDSFAAGTVRTTPWTHVTAAVGPGRYRLLFYANDTDGDGVFPELLVDNVKFTAMATAVPEPAAWVVMIAGFGFVGAILRQRRRMAMAAA
jgi:hypothetical protein